MTSETLTNRVTAESEFVRVLTGEVARAVHDKRPYTVVAVVPQHWPGEDMREMLQVASSAVRSLMRREDVAGQLPGETLAIGLCDADSRSAEIFGYRLQGDLRLRSFHLRNTVWDHGYAVLGRDGSTARELLSAAVESAKSHRRRLADWP
jgi:hypothetical protein